MGKFLMQNLVIEFRLFFIMDFVRTNFIKIKIKSPIKFVFCYFFVIFISEFLDSQQITFKNGLILRCLFD